MSASRIWPLIKVGCTILIIVLLVKIMLLDNKTGTLEIVDIMPGAEMKVVRESPTLTIVRFKAGSGEPAHHHSFGHDVMVMKGRKRVWNLGKKESLGLEPGKGEVRD
ncbi:uncharacterized protein A4U43_C08F22960 [Asparagus officinalis]|nr:uncharacterized protein A4U43_C08F22960 [Asparagus officinalis]